MKVAIDRIGHCWVHRYNSPTKKQSPGGQSNTRTRLHCLRLDCPQTDLQRAKNAIRTVDGQTPGRTMTIREHTR